jgi:hypothetical protein
MYMSEQLNPKRLAPVWRVILEVTFIIFLYYSNLLMGEFTHSGLGTTHGIIWALQDIFTETNFFIAVVSSIIGHLVFSILRNRL